MKIEQLDRGKRPLLEKRNESLDPYPRLLQHTLVVAPTMAGKTTTMVNLFRGPLCKKFDKIHVIMPTYFQDTVFRPNIELPEEQVYTEYKDEILDKIIADIEERRENGKKEVYDCLYIDDCLEGLKKSKKFHAFPSYARHFGLTIICCVQYLKGFLPRAARMQFGAIICFANMRNADIDAVAELSPVEKWKFMAALQHVRDKNREEGSIRHSLYINCAKADPFYRDLDVPLRIVEDDSRSRTRKSSRAGTSSAPPESDEDDR